MQSRERRLGRFVQNLQKRLCRTGWAALALFPVSDRVQRNINPLRKLDLAKPKPPANPACEFGRVQHRIGVVLSLVLGHVGLGGCINALDVDTADRLGVGALDVNLHAPIVVQ